MGQGVDFANLILGELARNETGGAALEVAEAALVPIEPMARLGAEYLFGFFTRAGIACGQIEIAPIDSARLVLRRIPRMVRVGEAHPHEPVVVGVERVEVCDRA